MLAFTEYLVSGRHSSVSHESLTLTPGGEAYDYPYCTGEEVNAHKGTVTVPRAHSKQVVGFEPSTVLGLVRHI